MPFESEPEESVWNSQNTPLKWPASIIGLLSAAIVTSSQYTDNPVWISAGKCFFWTATVLLIVFGLNRDLYTDLWACFIAFSLLFVQAFLIKLTWASIGSWNFIQLAFASSAQILLFSRHSFY
jgi:hypothetical protein